MYIVMFKYFNIIGDTFFYFYENVNRQVNRRQSFELLKIFVHHNYRLNIICLAIICIFLFFFL